jgi:hypothetical protein
LVFVILWIYSIIIAKVPDAFFGDFEGQDYWDYYNVIDSEFTSELLGWAHMWAFIILIYEKVFIECVLARIF